MGHIVNPIVFRVGISGSHVKWNSTWFFNLQNKRNFLKKIFNDYLVITYIYVFFRSLKKQSRSVRFTTFSKKIQKKFGTRKFKKRIHYFHYVIRRHSFVISHVKIIRFSDFLKVGVFFFDSSFVTNFNQFVSDYVVFSFFNYQKYKQAQRDRLSLLEGDKRRAERRRIKRRRRHLTYLLRYNNYYEIGRLYPSFFKEKNLKKKIHANFRGSLSGFVRSQSLFKRVNKNMRQFSYNNKAFFSIYKNLLWYVLIFRSFNYKFINNSFFLQKFLSSFYQSKFKVSFFSKIFDSCFLRKLFYSFDFKNKLRVKYFIYNIYLKKLKIKLFKLLIKRLRILTFLIKKYTAILEHNFNIMFNNVPTSILYINSLTIYNFCLKLLQFVYLELNQLKDFYYNKAHLFNYLKQFIHRRFVKIKKWTRLLIQVRKKKKSPILFKRDSQENLLQFYNTLFFGKFNSLYLFNRFFVSNDIITWKKYNNYFSTLLSSNSYVNVRKKFLKIFKILFLVLVQRLDLFWSKFVRRFYFKLFLYCCFFMLLFIMEYRNSFFINFSTWFKTKFVFENDDNNYKSFFSLILVNLKNKCSTFDLKPFSRLFNTIKSKIYGRFNKSVDFIRNSFVFLFIIKIFNLTNVLGSVLLKLIMLLQKNYYLCKRRFIRYSFVYQARFHLFLIYSSMFKTSFMFKKENKVSFSYYGLDQKSLTSGVVLRYICKLLRNRYPFKFILRNVIRDLNNYVRYIGGFRVVCAGRLTKKQRAAFVIRSGGAVNLSSLHVNVDFATDTVITKHGAVGLKLWLSRTKHFSPFFYKIEYIYN